jgi:hypothetical protein
LVKPSHWFAGVRSPPLRGVDGPKRRPSGKEPEMTRKAIFSEGCALRVRMARACSSRGIT